ncbi:MAG: hypothetical protein VXY39_00810, partial [Candidatus Thermoplasmatota archaeon]|nr:hypothetical protein [Candidatus Thermoplasmatota archaeon]
MDEPRLYGFVLGERTDEFLRQQSINAAVVGFLLHLVLCVLHGLGRIDLPGMEPLIDSYLDALYTPFSIILAYEVYELIRAIPESFSNAIGKQFEVVTLLVVRDIFKNLADLNETESTALYDPVAFIAVEVVAFIVLFATALYFRKTTSNAAPKLHADHALSAFVRQKKMLATALFVVYVLVALWSFTTWTNGVIGGEGNLSRTVFFSDFFTWLVMSDILILLISYKHTTDFNHLARNTGFVLSTVVIRVGIGTPGYAGAALFILA